MTRSLGAIAGGLSVADEAMVCRYNMLFYPGEKLLSVSDKLLDELKATQASVAPSRPYVPEPVITDAPPSTTGPSPVAAPVYAGARTTKAMDDALFSAAGRLQGRGTDRRRMILIVSDGRNEPRVITRMTLKRLGNRETPQRLINGLPDGSSSRSYFKTLRKVIMKQAI
jgi:hypothetical protein